MKLPRQMTLELNYQVNTFSGYAKKIKSPRKATIWHCNTRKKQMKVISIQNCFVGE